MGKHKLLESLSYLNSNYLNYMKQHWRTFRVADFFLSTGFSDLIQATMAELESAGKIEKAEEMAQCLMLLQGTAVVF